MHPRDPEVSMVFPVILAGGSGTRFWPLSRRARPKQFLSLGSPRSLLSVTAERALGLAPWARLRVVCGRAHGTAVQEHLPELPPGNLILEPIGRNTAPCALLAALHVLRQDPEGVVALLPADHRITRPDAFLDVARRAAERAAAGALVVLGIEPTRPETGFGYIEQGSVVGLDGVRRVERFVEKPDQVTASAYLASGRFLWNSGMVFVRADVLVAAMEEHLPELAAALLPLAPLLGSAAGDAAMEEAFVTLEGISLDHGLLEPLSLHGPAPVEVVAADGLGWSDLGHWSALHAFETPDAHGNVGDGERIAVNSTRNTVCSSGATVALVGVHDLVVVVTEDAVLVCHRDHAQEVRQVREKLAAAGRLELL
jgi:mannose-1-phosphate guanylyltransferase